jgi:hypothetical protein
MAPDFEVKADRASGEFGVAWQSTKIIGMLNSKMLFTA